MPILNSQTLAGLQVITVNQEHGIIATVDGSELAVQGSCLL